MPPTTRSRSMLYERDAFAKRLPPQTQEQSQLLCLPAEVRNVIYRHVFSAGTLEYCLQDAAIRICEHGEAHENIDRLRQQIQGPNEVLAVQKDHDDCLQRYGRQSLALLETCRQIYVEAALLPFTLNTFLLRPGVQKWLPSSITPAQSKHIRSLAIHILSITHLFELDLGRLDTLDRLSIRLRHFHEVPCWSSFSIAQCKCMSNIQILAASTIKAWLVEGKGVKARVVSVAMTVYETCDHCGNEVPEKTDPDTRAFCEALEQLLQERPRSVSEQ